jgi:hypothetical protein
MAARFVPLCTAVSKAQLSRDHVVPASQHNPFNLRPARLPLILHKQVIFHQLAYQSRSPALCGKGFLSV